MARRLSWRGQQHRGPSWNWLGVAVVFLGMGVASPAATQELFQTKVFQAGTDGYHGYRIPTIIEAANGDLLAIVEGRVDSFSDLGNIDLVMKRSTDRGATWSEMQLIRSDGTKTSGNPAPVVDRTTGDIHLLYSIDQSEVRVMTSSDHGQSWSEPRVIHDQVSKPDWTWHVPGPVHGFQLKRGEHAGRLVIPSDHISSSTGWGSHVVYSDDHGETWHLGGQVSTGTYGEHTISPNESTAVELVNGNIYLNFRNHGPDPNRAFSISTDAGLTFSDPQIDETLIEPQVQASVLRYSAVDQGDQKNILLFSNPATDVISAAGRRRMTVRASYDEGQTWTDGLLVEEGPAAYSDLVKLADGEIGLLYEAGEPLYQEIRFARFGIEAVDPEPFNGVEGDINQDGVFNLKDLDAFVQAWDPAGRWFGGAHSYRHGDINFDLKTDLRDVYLFRQLLVAEGLPISGLQSLLAVPEPCALPLMAGAVAGGWSVCQRQRR